jgi:hypothetical protein
LSWVPPPLLAYNFGLAIHPEDSSVTYIQMQGDKVNLGRVELDFSPEWVPDPAYPRDAQGAAGEATADDPVKTIAVPRARILVKGSDKVFEIRDLERIQRLRKMLRPARART